MTPERERVRPDELAVRAKAISRQKNFPFDLGEIVTYGFPKTPEAIPPGRVLTDKDKPESAKQ